MAYSVVAGYSNVLFCEKVYVNVNRDNRCFSRASATVSTRYDLEMVIVWLYGSSRQKKRFIALNGL